MDDRPGRVDGFRVALHHRVSRRDLAADVYRGAGRLCALHRQFVRDPGHGADAPCAMECISAVVYTGSPGEYLRRRGPGGHSRIWPGDLRRDINEVTAKEAPWRAQPTCARL